MQILRDLGQALISRINCQLETSIQKCIAVFNKSFSFLVHVEIVSERCGTLQKRIMSFGGGC